MPSFVLPSSWLDSPVRVVLAGAGGSGSEMLDGLVRIDRALRALQHPGLRISVFDPDAVSETNTIRQRFWPADVGHNKAELLAYRYMTFSGTRVRGFACALDPQTLESIRDLDLLVTCVDKALVRAQIGAAFAAERAAGAAGDPLWLDLGNGARDGQVVLGHLSGWRGDPARLPNVCELFPELAADAETLDRHDAPSCSAADALAAQDLFVNRAVAVFASDLLWSLLHRGRIEAHGCFLASSGNRVRELAIDLQTWASFGLVPNAERRTA